MLPPWEQVREALSYALDRPYLKACEFAFPSPYVPRLPELRAYAEQSFHAAPEHCAGEPGSDGPH